jgi:hypothetical protein
MTGTSLPAGEVLHRQRYRGDQAGNVPQRLQQNHVFQKPYHQQVWKEHELKNHETQQQYQNPKPSSVMYG